MKLFRYIGMNLRQTMGSSTFWYCVLAVFALCFTAAVTTDPKTDDELMVLQVLFRQELLEQNVDLNAYSVFCSSGGTWIAMFVPILSAFPFVPTFINNRITQNVRFTVSRIGKRCYQLGNIFSTFLTGGMTVMSGYALFGIALWILFPSLSDYSAQSATSYLEIQAWGKPEWYMSALTAQHFLLPIIVQLLQMFLYAGCSALLALAFATFVKNSYVVLCMPFFLTYGWAQINTRLSIWAYADFANLTQPFALLSLMEYGEDLPVLLCIQLGFALLLCGIFYLIMNRSVDCGE